MNAKDLFNIEGRKAIVTGGTRGLGYGMAEGLMEAGCEVAIVGTSDKVLMSQKDSVIEASSVMA